MALLAALGCLAQASGHTDPRTGVSIRCDVDSQMFPVAWQGGAIQASAMPLDRSEVDRSVACATAALGVYPTELVKRNLRTVYFAKELRFFHIPYGGTNSLDAVYISNMGASQGYTDAFLRGAFHHEFSSILLRNYADQFDRAAWREANAPGTEYRDGGTQAIADGSADMKYRPKYNVDGFLNQYGTASIEEDFNTYAEALLSGDREFWGVVARYPRVAKKKDLAVAFYKSLDPQFTEDFFRTLADK